MDNISPVSWKHTKAITSSFYYTADSITNSHSPSHLILAFIVCLLTCFCFSSFGIIISVLYMRLVIIYSCKIIFLWMKMKSRIKFRLYQQALTTAGQSATIFKFNKISGDLINVGICPSTARRLIYYLKCENQSSCCIYMESL